MIILYSVCIYIFNHMIKEFVMALTQAQIVESLVKTDETLTKKQVKAFLDAIAQLAYKEAKNGFTVPGLGKIVLVQRAARTGRNPATGESIKIPAKKVVKFRVAKAAKDAILGASGKKEKVAPKKKATAPKKAAPAKGKKK
jgi:DNA-binding protein HU-beta